MLVGRVMPAQAGIQGTLRHDWIPACAGMTRDDTPATGYLSFGSSASRSASVSSENAVTKAAMKSVAAASCHQ